jgi:hypothetical protein
MRDIVMEDITIRRAWGNSLITGLPGHPLRNIALRRVTLEFADNIDAARVLRKVPEFDAEFPPNEAWRLLPAYGFYCRHIEGLELLDVEITKVVEDQRPALILDDVADLTRQDIRAE